MKITREILSVKRMCRQILSNQENAHTSDDDQLTNIKSLLPIKSLEELDYIHEEMLKCEDFKTNLVS